MINRNVLLLICCLGLTFGSWPVFAQQDADRAAVTEVVERFYDWLLAYAQPDEAGQVHNPVVDRAYRDWEALTPRLIGEIDNLLAQAGQNVVANPFRCAQNVPIRVDVGVAMLEPEAQATVLLREYDAGNPRSHNLTVLLIWQEAQWKIDGIICGETITPDGVVQSFYDGYLAHGHPDAAGHVQNALADGVYRTSAILAPEFIAHIDANRLIPASGSPDPFVCTQDLPDHVSADAMRVTDDQAIVMVHAFFANAPTPKDLLVTLRLGGMSWQITAVQCDVPPQDMALDFYTWYLDYRRYDVENGIERTPLLDWDDSHHEHLSPTLLAQLVERFQSDETRVADPVLGSQDLPSQITVDVIRESQNVATLRVSGRYPSGPETYQTFPLVLVDVEATDGHWRLTHISPVP
jgi:hypothetical protein